MWRYVAQRLVLMVGILLGVLTITFMLSRVLPSSPVEMMLGHRPTPEQVEAAKKSLGLDRALYEQFFLYLRNAANGDLGTSLFTGRPVLDDLLSRAAATFELTTCSMLLVILIGVPLGVISAVRQNSLLDHGARTLSIAGMALPLFLIGMLLQMLFYGQLGWLPLQGRIDSIVLLDNPFNRTTGLFTLDAALSGQWTVFRDALWHLVLPVASLTLASLAVVARITRNMMVEVLGQDYIRTARAYGYASIKIYFFYALKATLIPMLTVIGLTYGFMLGGSVVIEYVFDWPGLGGYVVKAISRNDYPAVMGVTMFLSVVYLTVNLIVDLLYHAVDPRLRSS